MLGDDRKGRYKIFLGMAAGVGKTYRMLQEGHAEAEAGRDVVIGYLEPHGRADTVAQAERLEMVPRRRVSYRDTTIEEMVRPAYCQRRDQLAHTDAPSVDHAKCFDDIADVLAAAIDVYSTVNVQHLESLNDQVAELTGIRVRETVPDAVLGYADDVVLVDVTPDTLIERLLAGKVYPQARIEPALNNFFKLENLSALREVALRQVAEEVEAKRLPAETAGRTNHERLIDSAGPQAIGERLLALITPQPKSQRVVRRAWRSAQRLGAELDLLWVADHEPGDADADQLDALRKLASMLGAHLLVERGEDVALVTQQVAKERGTTYILMGTPRARSPLRRLTKPPLPSRLLALLPGVDLRIVADRTRRSKEEH